MTASILPSSVTGWFCATVLELPAPGVGLGWLLGFTCAFFSLLLEQPLKSSTNVRASTAVIAAVTALPIMRARLVEPFTIGFALKDFRSAMFVSPPLPGAAPIHMARRRPFMNSLIPCGLAQWWCCH